MKNTIISGIALAFLLSIAFSNSASGQSVMDKWPELKTFHSVMSQTFHPMEEGNFDPIRKRSGEMAEKAAALAKSAIPAEFNKPAMISAVKALKSGSKKLDKVVKKGAADEIVGKQLVSLHDTFHTIVGICRGEDH